MERVIRFFVPLAKRYGSVVLVTFASQATAALSLVFLPFLGLKVSDVYSAGIQVGNGAFTGIVLGVVYLLAIGRPNFNQWNAFGIASSLFSPALAAVTCVLILSKHGGGLSCGVIVAIFVCYGIGGACLALAGNYAVREACYGKPLLLAGSTIAANTGMIVATVIAFVLFRQTLAAQLLPAAAWMLLNIAQFVVARRRSLRLQSVQTVQAEQSDTAQNQALHAAALIIGVITSTILPTFYISAISKLPTGSMTVLFFSSRIASAVIGLSINALLMVRYNWVQRTEDNGTVSAAFMLFALLSGAVGLVAEHVLGVRVLGYGFVVLSWLASLIAMPLVLRELNARRLARVMMFKVLADLVVSIPVAVLLNAAPSITGYFSAFMISQCVNTVVAGYVFRNRLLTVGSVGTLAVSSALLVCGW